MIRKLLFIAFFILISNFIWSQVGLQQKADYIITAKLDTGTNRIFATEKILFYNSSLRDLYETYVHLWANAYSSKNTDFAKILLENKNTKMYFSKDELFGGYENIEFWQDDIKLDFEYVDLDKQIAKVQLIKPLDRYEYSQITIKYTLKLPYNFNGFGYEDDHFNMTLWYPKLAAYENKKWKYHPLNIYELKYADYGNYKIYLQIPETYTIAGSSQIDSIFTGDAFELKHENGYKILKFKDNYSNDFVWFCGSKLKMSHENLQIFKDSTTYDVNIFGTERRIRKFKKPSFIYTFNDELVYIDSVNRAGIPKEFNIIYDDKVLNRAYPNLITLSSKSKDEDQKLLENLIKMSLINTFDINPIESPWYISGITGFYQYNFVNFWEGKQRSYFKSFETFEDIREDYLNNYFYKSGYKSLDNYPVKCDFMVNVKYPSSFAFDYLNSVTGIGEWQQKMKNLYQYNQYTHLDTNYLQRYYENNFYIHADWLFNGVLNYRNPFRYSLEKVEQNEDTYTVTVSNKGELFMPYSLKLMKGDSTLNTFINKGHRNDFEYTINNKGATRIKLETVDYLMDSDSIRTIYFLNNSLLNRFPYLEKYKNFYKWFFPVVGYNQSDGIELGLVYDFKKSNTFDMNSLMFYGLDTKEIVGNLSADYQYKINQNRYLTGRFYFSSFHRLRRDDYQLRYRVYKPGISYRIYKPQCKCCNVQDFSYNFYYINDESYNGTTLDKFNRIINKFTYTKLKGKPLSKSTIILEAEHQFYRYFDFHQYFQINAQWNHEIMYKPDRYLKFRIYGATYLYNSDKYSTGTNYGTLSLVGYNLNQYTYEEPLFGGRTAQEGFWTRQLGMGTGNFKTGISNSYGIGQSNNYVMALNILIDPPFTSFIKPYADFGMYGDLPTVSEGYQNKFLYSVGLMITLNDFVDIYFPLINSKEIEDAYKEMFNSPIIGKISFSFNTKINSIIR